MKIKLIAIVVALTAASTFAMARIQEHENHGSSHMHMGMMQQCPMHLEGVESIVEDTVNGVSITFTTKSANVADLRFRVEKMAKMHEADSRQGMMQRMMIPFTATYEEVPNGARVTLKPQDPAKLSELRAKVREHIETMKNGTHPMMHQMMH